MTLMYGTCPQHNFLLIKDGECPDCGGLDGDHDDDPKDDCDLDE